MNSKAKIIPNTCFTTRNFDNTILLNYEDDLYFGLDKIGSEYWELIQEYKDFDMVVDNMLSKYPNVSREEIKTDLNELIFKMVDKGLIRVERHD